MCGLIKNEQITPPPISSPSRGRIEVRGRRNFKIFIITGDVSGDLEGSLLAKSLLKKLPNLQILGVGGERMRTAGIEILFDLTKFSLIGFLGVLRHIFFFRRIFYQLIARIKKEKPSLVIFIDYPGFNLRVAEKIKRFSIPLIYYVSPQVWAWGKGRIQKIVSLITQMITILPFEKEIYEREGLAVEFVGHPLLDLVKPSKNKEQIMKYFSLKEGYSLITFLPGSRLDEVRRLLPVMLKLGQLIKREKPKTQCMIIAANSLIKEEIKGILKKKGISIPIIKEKKYDLISASALVLTASGTATIEIGILERPMIILYKISPFAYPFLKMTVKIPYIGMVNIIAKRKIVPEFIQREANALRILPTALSLLDNKEKREEMKLQLKIVKKALGEPGAADRAAKIISEYL